MLIFILWKNGKFSKMHTSSASQALVFAIFFSFFFLLFISLVSFRYFWRTTHCNEIEIFCVHFRYICNVAMINVHVNDPVTEIIYSNDLSLVVQWHSIANQAQDTQFLLSLLMPLYFHQYLKNKKQKTNFLHLLIWFICKILRTFLNLASAIRIQ